jgi:hypothetical protein
MLHNTFAASISATRPSVTREGGSILDTNVHLQPGAVGAKNSRSGQVSWSPAGCWSCGLKCGVAGRAHPLVGRSKSGPAFWCESSQARKVPLCVQPAETFQSRRQRLISRVNDQPRRQFLSSNYIRGASKREKESQPVCRTRGWRGCSRADQ